MTAAPLFAYVGSRTTRERNARGDGITVFRVDEEHGTLDRIQTGTAQFLIGTLQIFFFLVQVIAQQGKARQAIDFSRRQKTNAGGINAQRALDTAAA